MFVMHTVGNSDLHQQILSALVLTLGDTAFASLQRLCVFIGGFYALYCAVTHRDLMSYVYWCLRVVVILNVLLAPKTSLLIVDSDIKHQRYRVDGVPIALAIMASTVTSLGYGLTHVVETYFSIPGEPAYTKTGMLFSSQLLVESAHLVITDPLFKTHLDAYLKTCVFYDLLLNKYTVSDLSQSPDVWGFLREHASASRVVLYGNTVMTCQAAMTHLDTDWKAVVAQSNTQLAQRFFPGQSLQQAMMNNLLSNSYQHLTALSKDASAIVRQDLLYNALDAALSGFTQYDMGLTARVNMSTTLANEQLSTLYHSFSRLALTWLPLIRNALEAVMMACSLFVILLAFFPMGTQVMSQFMYSLIWLQLWSPLYAILHFIGSFYSSIQTRALSGHGLGFSAQLPFVRINEDMIAVVGYLSLSIPFLAAGVMRGMMQTVVSTSQMLTNGLQSAASSSANSVSAGNVSLGNVNLDNTNWGNEAFANTRGFHHEANSVIQTGNHQEQLSSGAVATTYPDGASVLSESPTYSDVGYRLVTRDALLAHSSAQSSEAWNRFEQEQTSSVQSYTHLFDRIHDSESEHQQMQQTSHSDQRSHARQQHHSTADIQEMMSSFQSEFSTDTSTTHRVMGAMVADTKAGLAFDSQHSAVGKLVAKGIGGQIDVGASVGGHHERSNTDETRVSDLTRELSQWAKTHQVSNVVDTLDQTLSAEEKNRLHTDVTQTADRMRHDIAKANGHSVAQTQAFERAQHYTHLSESIQSHALEVENTAEQDFYEWMLSQSSRHGEGNMSVAEVDAALHDPVLSQHYLDGFVETLSAKFALDHPSPLNLLKDRVQKATSH